ncbi:hypothetical protein RJT34_32929 [Clitoria ternatea]|uniref:Uncharacterized protein n=1 Tax=Clitoria ternatea TaxID=43366 RepID=A0AAN9EXV4_CLITE
MRGMAFSSPQPPNWRKHLTLTFLKLKNNHHTPFLLGLSSLPAYCVLRTANKLQVSQRRFTVHTFTHSPLLFNNKKSIPLLV